MTPSLKNLMEALPEGVDGAIITSGANRRYFTRLQSSAGTLLVTRNTACFIIDFRYIEKARSVITGYDVLLQDKLHEQIAAFFKKENAVKIAVEASSMTVAQFNDFGKKLPELTLDGSGTLSERIDVLRCRKSPEEID